jgi:hypothetical protein
MKNEPIIKVTDTVAQRTRGINNFAADVNIFRQAIVGRVSAMKKTIGTIEAKIHESQRSSNLASDVNAKCHSDIHTRCDQAEVNLHRAFDRIQKLEQTSAKILEFCRIIHRNTKYRIVINAFGLSFMLGVRKQCDQ